MQLNGFTSRAIRGSAPAPPVPDQLYVTEWCAHGGEPLQADMIMLVLGGIECTRATSFGHTAGVGEVMALAVVTATYNAGFEFQALCVAEVALAVIQEQASKAIAPTVWLVTRGVQQPLGVRVHAGVWGIARSARAEVQLPLFCVDGPAAAALQLGASPEEPEALMHGNMHCMPRLKTASGTFKGLVRLHLHGRGAMSNLYVEAQPPLVLLNETEVLLHVRAVGLNFRDVLNVLGEYPGDPGPPGGDSAGTSGNSDIRAATDMAFGLADAPLSSVARASKLLLAPKPVCLAFTEACTLPVVWSTTHAAFHKAENRAGHRLVAQAAAGGVGLKAVEYSQWLHLDIIGTAGRPNKHFHLRSVGVVALCSSRDGAAFASGSASTCNSRRSHMVFNSLSLDFIAVSLASLGEGGALQEIGKRAVWSLGQQQASAPHTAYCVIALDADLASDPVWMHGVLNTLSVRASAAVVESLPLRSFDMETQYEVAFHTLQTGLNTGKIAVTIAPRGAASAVGSHVVTGGTGGLGMLTARWLAQLGASALTLASRRGAVSAEVATEWDAVRCHCPDASAETCDAGEEADTSRLVSLRSPLQGVWHLAGMLADNMLPKQDAQSFALVYAPKVHGAWTLQTLCATTALRTFAMFSSVAALLGGAAQENYAAANACLDALASCRRTHGCTSASIQWAGWAEVGMSARGAAVERMAAMEAKSGFGRIGLEQGLSALAIAVRDGAPCTLGAAPVVWSKFLGPMPVVPAFLSGFTPANVGGGAAGVGVVGSKGGALSLESVLEMVKRTAGGVVDADVPLMEAGVDSLGAVELRNQLQRAVGDCSVSLPPTLVFDHPIARQLATLLQPEQDQPSADLTEGALVGASAPSAGGVAVEGMGALFPLCAGTARAASLLVSSGSNAITEVPLWRWDMATQHAMPEPAASRVRHMGWLLEAVFLDNVAFNVSPMEAAAMDPTQRLLLERGYAALHDAGRDRSSLGGSGTGIFVGCATTEFTGVLASSPVGSSVYAATGAALAIACGRLSYALGMQGPCYAIDTACSAGLMANHAGLRALQLRECAVGLVSGVNIMLAPGIGSSFAIAGMTSPLGRSHTFDIRADGYARGEACGAISLHCDGAASAAILEEIGSAVRQDGRSASLTAPNGQAQQGLIRAALGDAAVTADALTLSQAHGTGTSLGDPIEAGSLMALLTDRSAPLVVGGVKANIGHAEPAAGMTGLLTLALQLRAGMAAPNAHLRVANPRVTAVLAKACALPVQSGKPSSETIASGGVSSFGYGGTIAHAALQSISIDGGAEIKPNPLHPLRYSRRAFMWLDPRASLGENEVFGHQTTLKNQSVAIRVALEKLVPIHSHSPPPTAALVVVGTGLRGLIFANKFSQLGGKDLVILERTATIGGVWHYYANPFSRVQNSEPSYRMPVKVAPTRSGNFKGYLHQPYEFEVLDSCRQIIEQCALCKNIFLKTEVTRVSASGTNWRVSAKQLISGQKVAVTGELAVLCLNIRLGLPRNVAYPGKELFGGLIRRGIAGDTNDLNWEKKLVVVLGMGAYAIENMRTALEHKASHVVILCRQRGTVSPRAIDWINNVRPHDAEFWRDAAGNVAQLALWRETYMLVGANPPEAWDEGKLKADGHGISVGDMFFVAHYAQRTITKLGVVESLEPNGVVSSTRDEVFPADILIKCVGFMHNNTVEGIIGRSHMVDTGGKLGEGLYLQAEYYQDFSSHTDSVLGLTIVSGAEIGARMILEWRDAVRGSEVIERTRIHTACYSTLQNGFRKRLFSDPKLEELLRGVHHEVRGRFNASATPYQFLTQHQREWDLLHSMLMPGAENDGKAKYLFFGLLDVLVREAPHLLEDMPAKGAKQAQALALQVAPVVSTLISIDRVLGVLLVKSLGTRASTLTRH